MCAPRGRGDGSLQGKGEPVIFADDQGGLDGQVKRFMGETDSKYVINKQDKTQNPTDKEPSSPTEKKHSCTPQIATSTTCFRTTHVRDNERPGQRGILPAFYFKDCKLEGIGAGRGQWFVCPRGLGPDSKIFAFGISSAEGHHDMSFEKDLLDSYDSTVLLFDPLPSAKVFVNGLINSAEGTFKEQIFEKKFRYTQLGLWEKDGSLGFTKDGKRTEVNPSMVLPVVRLTTLLCMYAPNWIDILKIDFPSHWPEVLWDLEKIEELPVDQILVRFSGHLDSEVRELTNKVLKRKGFVPLSGNYFTDDKVTYVRAYYIMGDAPLF